MPKASKKAVIRSRIQGGVNAIPLDRGFEYVNKSFREDIESKTVASIIKAWVKKVFSEAERTLILAKPEYHFQMFSGYAAAIHWMNKGMDFPKEYVEYPQRIRQYFLSLIANEVARENDDKDSSSKKVLSPMDLMKNRVNDTIHRDIDELEDQWIAGEKTTLDLSTRIQFHDLKPKAVMFIRPRLETMLSEYSDAINKQCDQAVEAFSHVNKTELKRRIKAIRDMMEQLDRIQDIAKKTRKPKSVKPKPAEKQIQNIKYAKEDKEYGVISITPNKIIGAYRLYTFHSTTRTLTEYVCDSPSGFEVKGTTIQRIDESLSRSVRLRKPKEMLDIVSSKTPNQINNAWKDLTTKTSYNPNGRLNENTVLVRVLNR